MNNNTSATTVQRASAQEVWSSYDTFVFDADGVLWTGKYAVPGAPELLSSLIQGGKRVFVLTNNATCTPDEYAEKCARLGFNGLTHKNIVSSGMVAVHELQKLKEGAETEEEKNLPVFLFGSKGLQNILTAAGIETIGVGSDCIEKYTDDTFLFDVDVSKRVCAVVASFDPHLSYPKIMKAVNYLKDSSLPFIVTNEDMTFPGSVPGVVVPGAGAVSAVLKAVSGRQPVVMGKPHTATFNYIRHTIGDGFDASKTLMIGDRCETDMAFGNAHQLDTLLVLTGIHSLEDVERFKEEGQMNLVPKMWIGSVADLGLK